MQYPKRLIESVLIRRYKRFLADVRLTDGSVHTVHCPNTGRMTGMDAPGSAARLSVSMNPKRKYPMTLEQVQVADGEWVGVNPGLANGLGVEAIAGGLVQGFSGFRLEKREPRFDYGRLDLLYCDHENARVWVEIKSVTLAMGGDGLFPDTPSERAVKHLQGLVDLVKAGDRAVLLYCAQRADVNSVMAAAEIDPLYAQSLLAAKSSGVEVYAFTCRPCNSSIDPLAAVPVR